MKTELKIEKIIDFLLAEIDSGRIKTGDRILSEYRLADKFNVHKSTANRAVACLVERGLLKRCPGGAGTIVTKTTEYPIGNLGYLISLSGISFTTLLLNGAQSAAFDKRYALNYLQWCQLEELDYFWNLIENSNLQGLLITGGTLPEKLSYPSIYVNSVPMTIIERNDEFNWISPDNLNGGYLIGKYLLELGHKEIVFIASASQSMNIKKRAEGFRNALQERGIEDLEKRFYRLAQGGADLVATLEVIYKEFPKLTAIAFDQDPLAARAILYLKKKGINVPHDVSITGFGMVNECHHPVKITSIEEYPVQLAYHAANRLIDVIENRISEPIREFLPVELVPGESTAAITTNR